MKSREFDLLVNKLKLEVRDTGDRHAFLVHEGKKVVKTKISHGHCELPVFFQETTLREREVAIRFTELHSFQVRLLEHSKGKGKALA